MVNHLEARLLNLIAQPEHLTKVNSPGILMTGAGGVLSVSISKACSYLEGSC